MIAVETRGADSFAQSLAAGVQIELPAITSIATSLGAKRVSAAAFELAQRGPVESIVVSDAAALAGCYDLLNEHRILVEPACGASVAALSTDSPLLAAAQDVVVVVCGGVGVSVEQLAAWRVQLTPA